MYSGGFNRDDEKVQKDLNDFIPDCVFDIHAHLYCVGDLNIGEGNFLQKGPQEAGTEVWKERIVNIIGKGKLTGGLFFPYPAVKGDVKAQNFFLVEQLNHTPDSRGLVLVPADFQPEEAEEYLKNRAIAGFKVYYIFGKEDSTFQADISSYAPEWLWELADRYGAVIMLHLVKTAALADLENQRQIVDMCSKYPGVKLILAHAARGFHWYNTSKGISALRGLENVWFDTSGVCQPGAIKSILNEFGPRKLLWGTDFPISQIRGKCVTMGDGFAWIQDGTVDWNQLVPGCNPVLVGIESLRALKDAAEDFGLNQKDVNDIFYNNAMRLLGIKKESGSLTQDLYLHAKQIIPGGTQLLSKRPEMFAPDCWPAYYREARGCEVWDLDGRHYYDMSSNGIGSCLLGFRDSDVTSAVHRRVNLGSMCTLNAPEEVELAEELCEIHPWAQQVRFTRTGGETAAVAVRIARAVTDRSIVAICGYHGWMDWYLAANLGEMDALKGHLLPGLNPNGVPDHLRGSAVTFRYNNLEEFNAIVNRFGDKLAAVIMEPCRNNDPEEGFLEHVREQTRKCGALLIFDEITIGWRLTFGGAHLKLGVIPDIAIFAKALGNGHPIGAIIGTKEAMQGAHISFISSTYWTEGVGPAAALATLKKMRETNVPRHVGKIGKMVSDLWKHNSMKHNLPVTAGAGYPCLAHFGFKHPQAEELRTFYTQRMLERGFLAGTSIYPTLAHSEKIVALYGSAIDEVFGEMSQVLKNGSIYQQLKGPVAHSGFRRLI